MKKIIKISFIILILIVIITISINLYVYFITKSKIKKIDNINDQDIDCIIILGAGIRGTKPSPMLEDRLLTGSEIYHQNKTTKIIVSGDHGRENYDEVNVMKNYLIEEGIPSENIFMDHAGFSTYDSTYRAKEIFGTKKIIIVTQDYHLYRSLYIAKNLGVEAYGVSATKREYQFQIKRDIREFAARIKDVIQCMFKPKPKFLGELIPITGNGDMTNDK